MGQACPNQREIKAMLLQILILLIVVGALLYLLNILPIDATVKRIIQVIGIVIVAIYLLKLLLPASGL